MKIDRIGLAGLSILSVLILAGSAAAQTSVGSSVVVGTASTLYIYGLDSGSVSTSAPITAATTHSFTGKDSAGHTQTMAFSGSATAQSNYDSLHVFSAGPMRPNPAPLPSSH